MTHIESFLWGFDDPNSEYQLVFEDDYKAAYAYLRCEGQGIVSHVWLYNRVATPKRLKWGLIRNAPSVNSAKYVKDGEGVAPVDKFSDLKVVWGDVVGADCMVELYIRGERFARLRSDAKTGYSFQTKRDSVLSKILV
ncbi:MAG: hypothetical protein JKY60_15975 [Kordiimonadaceae bacterium]|nr:hypothetical protein [Kordiimonadaceae bacterium]